MYGGNGHGHDGVHCVANFSKGPGHGGGRCPKNSVTMKKNLIVLAATHGPLCSEKNNRVRVASALPKEATVTVTFIVVAQKISNDNVTVVRGVASIHAARQMHRLFAALQRSQKGCLQGLSVPGALEYRLGHIWARHALADSIGVESPPSAPTPHGAHIRIRQEGVDPRTAETEKSVERAWTNTGGKQPHPIRQYRPFPPPTSRGSIIAGEVRSMFALFTGGNFTIVKLGGMRRYGSGEYEVYGEGSTSVSRADRGWVAALGGRTHGTEWECGGGGALYVSTPKDGNKDVKDSYKAKAQQIRPK
ncbi:hypothetical protein C8R44DRAFT_749641 [Mycena epipterygia]|nr:hypothetical protein C8R44DRAFT_749641 [Mycena epipterygia]